MTRLSPRQDAFGRVMYDRLRGQGGNTVVERDDGYVDVDNLTALYLADYKGWPAFERRAIRLAAGRVLDIGCGAGRVGLYLQRKGLDVVGVDNSPLAIKVCQLRGLRHARLLSITQLSRRLGTFDTLVMYGNNLGLLGSPRRARWLLERFHAMTSDRARIIAETLDPYKTKETHHLEYHRRNRRRGRMPGQIRIRVRYQRYASPWFDYLFISPRELRDLLAGTGWRVGHRIESDGPVYIAVIEKEV